MSQYPIGMRQYGSSPIINQIVEFLGQNFDYQDVIDSFYDICWNIDTAQGFWLDVWGRKVGVSRVIRIPVDINYVGFNPYFETLGFGQLYGLLSDDQQNYYLSDDNYRILILAKAFSNITDCSTPELNQLLKILFPGQLAYVSNLFSMVMVYVFAFTVTVAQRAIITGANVLPHPSGVATFALFGNLFNTIGFNPYGMTFGYGTLFDANSLVKIA